MSLHDHGWRTRRLVPVVALVGLLHAGVFVLLWTMAAPLDRQAPAFARTSPIVWLKTAADLPQRELLPPLAPSPGPRRPAPRPWENADRSAPSGAPQPAQLSVEEREAQAITLSGPVARDAADGPAASGASQPAMGAVAGRSVAPQPLNLQLPRGASAPWRQRNPALEDARVLAPALTLERRLAQAMGGDGQWQTERLDNDRLRLRRGAECVMVVRSRAGQLDLGGGTFRDTWQVGYC
jgi:hypothetical protein